MNPLRARSPLPALLGATCAAVGASVCCVVPLLLVLMGVSGAWISTLTAFDAWRPWFTGATLILLALAFWTVYRPASRCPSEGECADPRALRRRRLGIWIGSALIVLLLLFPYYIVWIL